MTFDTEHSRVMKLQTAIEKLNEELEAICFSVKAPEDATMSARIRRKQLMDVKEFLAGTRTSL